MKRLLFFTVLCTGIAMFLAGPVCAKVTGPCADCHTMHNSQGGEFEDADGPYRHLTKGDCIGCHTGPNVGGGTAEGETPFVYDTSAPTYDTDTLAGGNFYWVAQTGGDAKGHNVLGLSAQDVNISAAEGAPGSWVTCANTCHNTLAAEQTVISDLGSGCEGCHLYVKHHAGGSDTPDIADAEDGWFRFCAGHMSGVDQGVTGIEDNDWQYTKGAGDHNEYLGNVGTHTANAGFYNLDDTMTAYCSGCHGGFHLQEDGAWIRHPSDAILPSDADKEYQFYTVYDPIAPVARPDLAAIGAPETVVPGEDMVMCLSCHRAHGSPYDDILRWDYSAMVAGGGGSGGCFVCHTTKDDI